MRFTLAKGLVLVILSSVLFGCKDDESNSPNVPVTFLATGASFDYYYSDFLYEDSVRTVIGEQIGKDTFLVRNYSETVTVFPVQYWVLKDGALHTSFRLRDPNSYAIECKFNKPKGHSWEVKKGGITFTYTIDELNATVVTGEGVVNDAIKIKMTAQGANTAYQYVSPSVGLLGTGDFDDENESVRLVKYQLGTAATTTNVVPAITYGDFPFMKVNNFWEYYESSFVGEDVLTVTIESKLANKNIYKVLVEYQSGESSYGYWYEDNGFLMAYDEGEEIIEADPIYVSDQKAEIGLGWAGLTESGTFYIYKVEELDATVDTYFGSLSATGIYVTDGLFSSHINYWNANKGNVLVTGMVERDVTNSNAKQAGKTKPFMPIIGL